MILAGNKFGTEHIVGSPVHSQDDLKAKYEEMVPAQIRSFEQTSRQWVIDHPYISLGIAATIGVTLGCLIKRR